MFEVICDRSRMSVIYICLHSVFYRHLERLELDSLTPVQLLMKTCLYPQISKVSASLLQILKQEYHLMDYFAATRVSTDATQVLVELILQVEIPRNLQNKS